MKKTLLTLTGAIALTLGHVAIASACDGDKTCECQHGKDKTAAARSAKAEKVSLVGTVVSFGCPMEAARQQCTGAALVVGETKHLIKSAAKGRQLVGKAKDTNKQVAVSGTKKGDFLTVESFDIKG